MRPAHGRDAERLREGLALARRLPDESLSMAVFCGRHADARRILSELAAKLEKLEAAELEKIRDEYGGIARDVDEPARGFRELGIIEKYASFPAVIRALDAWLPSTDFEGAAALSSEVEDLMAARDPFALAARLDPLTRGVHPDCDTSRRSGRSHPACHVPPVLHELQDELRARKSVVARAAMKERRGVARPQAPAEDPHLWCLYHGLDPVRQSLTPEQFVRRAGVDVDSYARQHGIPRALLETRMKEMGVGEGAPVTGGDEIGKRLSQGRAIAWISWFESGPQPMEQIVVLSRAAGERVYVLDPTLRYETWCTVPELEALDLRVAEIHAGILAGWLKS